MVEKEEGSESEVEVTRDSKIQELDDHSHVHFSVDTNNKVKCEVRTQGFNSTHHYVRLP